MSLAAALKAEPSVVAGSVSGIFDFLDLHSPGMFDTTESVIHSDFSLS